MITGRQFNLFHGTNIPVVVLVLKSNRNGNSDNIIFIDASKEYKPGKVQNELPDEAIAKIVDAYCRRVDVDKFCSVVSRDKIAENAFNLNIPRYVDTSESEKEIDFAEVKTELAIVKSRAFIYNDPARGRCISSCGTGS